MIDRIQINPDGNPEVNAERNFKDIHVGSEKTGQIKIGSLLVRNIKVDIGHLTKIDEKVTNLGTSYIDQLRVFYDVPLNKSSMVDFLNAQLGEKKFTKGGFLGWVLQVIMK